MRGLRRPIAATRAAPPTLPARSPRTGESRAAVAADRHRAASTARPEALAKQPLDSRRYHLRPRNSAARRSIGASRQDSCSKSRNNLDWSLAAALENWAVQREPDDVLVLVSAAKAAGQMRELPAACVRACAHCRAERCAGDCPVRGLRGAMNLLRNQGWMPALLLAAPLVQAHIASNGFLTLQVDQCTNIRRSRDSPQFAMANLRLAWITTVTAKSLGVSCGSVRQHCRPMCWDTFIYPARRRARWNSVPSKSM